MAGKTDEVERTEIWNGQATHILYKNGTSKVEHKDGREPVKMTSRKSKRLD
jgi:hypothetical protein